MRGLASCINQFFNKYNELCFFRWGIERQRKPGAEAGLVRQYLLSSSDMNESADEHFRVHRNVRGSSCAHKPVCRVRRYSHHDLHHVPS